MGWVAVVIIFGVGVLVAVGVDRARRLRIREAWLEAARRLGAEATVSPVSWFGGFAAGLTGDVDGIAIEAAQRGRGRYATTEVGTRAEGAEDLFIAVASEPSLSFHAASLGAATVEVAGLDPPFAVRSNAPERASAWLSEQVTMRLSDAAPCQIVLDRGRLQGTRPGDGDDPTGIESLARAVASLANAGHRLMDRWVELADALEADPLDARGALAPATAPPIHLTHDRTLLTVDTVERTRRRTGYQLHRTFTRVRTRSQPPTKRRFAFVDEEHEPWLEPPELEPTTSRLDGTYRATADGGEPIAELDEALSQQLAGIAPAALWLDRAGVTLLLHGLITEPDRVKVAIEFVALLAERAAAGPYR